MVDTQYITCTVRNIFTELGFEGNRFNGPKYFTYTKKGEREDCGSITSDSMSVTYYINGHVGFLSPATFEFGDEGKVREDIEKHLFENRHLLY